MKKSMILTTLAALVIGFSTVAAADCVVSYTRTACQGQQAVSYKKCDGKQSCDKTKAAKNMHACWQQAVKSCNNGRLDITKYKEITAKYNGQALVGGFDANGAPSDSGSNFCWSKRPDLNQCQ